MSCIRTAFTGVLLVASSLLSVAGVAGETPATDAARQIAASGTIELEVYKSPSCGCCSSWIEHVKHYGFESRVHHPQQLNAIKDEQGIDHRFRSCHTAVSAEGYVFEGHVPARLIQRFLAQPPEGALGLAVPGMPLGSPGMEMGDRFNAYPVVLLYRDGRYQLYEEIRDQASQY